MRDHDGEMMRAQTYPKEILLKLYLSPILCVIFLLLMLFGSTFKLFPV